MSVQHVILSAAAETHGPPSQVVTVSTALGDDGHPWVFLDVDEYAETNDTRIHKTVAHVPPLRLLELVRALVACEPSCGAILQPYQLPSVRAVERAERESGATKDESVGGVPGEQT